MIVEKTKKYDLEDRTLKFAKDVRMFVKKIPKSISVFEDAKQLVRSSGSVGANYIEANEAISKKDFLYRIKICRKESKESKYWLELICDCISDQEYKNECMKLINESVELMKILSSIMRKSE